MTLECEVSTVEGTEFLPYGVRQPVQRDGDHFSFTGSPPPIDRKWNEAHRQQAHTLAVQFFKPNNTLSEYYLRLVPYDRGQGGLVRQGSTSHTPVTDLKAGENTEYQLGPYRIRVTGS